MNLLVVSTVSCFLEYIAPIFIKYIITRMYTRKKYDVELRNDLINLKREMAGISMVDEFSKYAKLQRKFKKLEDTLREQVNERVSARMKVQSTVTFIFQNLNGLMIFILLYWYNNEPVVILPENSLWPIQGLLSWPCSHKDSISFVVWLTIVETVVSMCKKCGAQ